MAVGVIPRLLLLLLGAVVPLNGDICTTMVCQYDFDVRLGRTMTYRTPDESKTLPVQLNGTRLQVVENQFYLKAQVPEVGQFLLPEEVTTADGFERDIITINGGFPGPTIEVLEGAQVELRVTNNLFTEGITVHFHGVTMRDNLWMDGVPMITQFPIEPSHTFTYKFKAYPVGTHWYHSHFYNQRLDGLFGMFVVHKQVPVTPHFVFTVMDWYHIRYSTMKSMDPFQAPLHGPGDGFLDQNLAVKSPDNVVESAIQYVAGLLNGRGRMDSQPFPLTRFQIQPGEMHVFHACHSGAEYAFEISVDGHELFIRGLGANAIYDIRADFLLIYPGECYEFAIQTNISLSNYWLRAKLTNDPRLNAPVPEVRAILQGNADESDPGSTEQECTETHHCVTFNCPFQNYADEFYRECIASDQARSVELTGEMQPPDRPIITEFFNFNFNNGPSTNARSWANPTEPYICGNPAAVTPCPADCSKGCSCTYTASYPANHTIRMVYSAMEPGSPMHSHHSMHLHGHDFYVLRVGYPDFNHTSGYFTTPNPDIACGDNFCTNPTWAAGSSPVLNLDRPPVKDTVVVPSQGYVVIQLVDPNPGFWLMHCHQELHLEEGMIMVIHIDGQIPDPESIDYVWQCTNPPKLAAQGRKDPSVSGGSGGSSVVSVTVIALVSMVIGLMVVAVIIVIRNSKQSRHPYMPLPGDAEENNEDSAFGTGESNHTVIDN